MVHQDDFVSTWEAIDNASDLSFELGFAQGPVCPPAASAFSKSAGSSKKVRFGSRVDLYLDNDLVDVSFVIPHSTLKSWPNKPWGLDLYPE